MTVILSLLLYYTPLWALTQMEVGQRHLLPAAADAKIHIQPSRLFQINEVSSGIRLEAKAPGHVQVQVNGQSHTFQILPRGGLGFQKEVRSVLEKMMGPSLRIKNGQFIIEGQIHRHWDWNEILKVARSYGQRIQFHCDFDKDVQSEVEKDVAQLLKSKGIRSYLIDWSPYPRVQVAKKYKEDFPNLALEIEALGFGLEYNGQQLALSPLVKLRLIIAEVTRSQQSDLGLRWPTSPQFDLAKSQWKHEDLMLSLQLAEGKGRGQILATPQLVARSGGQAEFLAGGELPIPIFRKFGRSVQWKSYGVLLKFQPQVDTGDHVRLKVQAEISTPDPGSSVDNVPAMKTNRVSSQVDLRNQQTVALSGLLKNLESLNQESLALLGEIPLLGAFFRSNTKRSRQTELVIFLTPEVDRRPWNEPVQKPKSWEGPFEH